MVHYIKDLYLSRVVEKPVIYAGDFTILKMAKRSFLIKLLVLVSLVSLTMLMYEAGTLE